MKKLKLFFNFNSVLWLFLGITLILKWINFFDGAEKEKILIWFVYLATIPVVISAIRALISKKITVDLLAAVALVAAILDKEWFSVIFINLMITSARIFVNYIEGRSKQEIESLLKLRPEKAKVERGGKVIEISIDQIKIGDLVVVELGDRVPVDGKIIKGSATIDQSSLTGESVPISKNVGDEVLSSSVVATGIIMISAEKVGKDTTLEKFIELVNQSHQNKSKISTLSDRFSSYYIITMFIVAIGTYFYSHSLALVLSILLVSCADDLAVAVPMAFSAAIVAGAKRGAIVKGGDFIEGISKLETVVVDKTGTLTKGKLKVFEIIAFNNKKEEDVVYFAGVASVLSHHPAALAVVRYAMEKNVQINEPEKFSEQSGKGAEAIYKDKQIFIGKRDFLEANGVKITASQIADIEKEKAKGYSTMFVADDHELAGVVIMADEVRPETKKAIEELKQEGVKNIVMLTGDNEKIAQRIADEVGITNYHANLLPEEKIKYLKTYINNKTKTAMIGDGVNDAAALALADIGIAMGAVGSDVAIESADIALMKDNLLAVPEMIKIGNKTIKIVYQDIWIWAIVNLIGLVLVFAGILGPTGAAAFNFITDFFPIINSFRLFKE